MAFSLYQRIMADRGVVSLDDPCALFADEGAVRAMLARAGYASVEISSSPEINLRRGRTPAEWAESMWRVCSTMPHGPAATLLPAEELPGLEREYKAAAEALAHELETPEGITERYCMLWVLARK